MDLLQAWAIASAAPFLFLVKVGQIADDNITHNSKQGVSCWLLNAQPQRAFCGWANAWAHLFDTVFGVRHVSLKCFCRSALASVLAVGFCLLVAWPLYIEPIVLYGWSADIGLNVAFAVMVNIAIDYVSLLETRIAVNVIKRQRRSSGRCAVLAADFLLTSIGSAFVFFLIMFFVGVMDVISDFPVKDPAVLLIFAPFVALDMLFCEVFLQEGFLAGFVDALRASRDSAQVAFAPFLWSTYFTSVWLWLTLVAAGVNRIGSWMGTWHHVATRHLKIRERPFSALGIIGGVVVVGVTTAGTLILALLK